MAEQELLPESKKTYHVCDNPECSYHENLIHERDKDKPWVGVLVSSHRGRDHIEQVDRYRYGREPGKRLYFCPVCHGAIQMVIKASTPHVDPWHPLSGEKTKSV